MTAEAIAEVVADLRGGRVKRLPPIDEVAATGGQALDERLQDYAESARTLAGPVVDMTAIYQSLVNREGGVRPYDDHPCIAPPWEAATFAYENEHGNVVVFTSMAIDHDQDGVRWETDNPVDWGRVRWIFDSFVWVGGRSGDGRKIRTGGPWAMWRYAIYEDGAPADLNWVELCDYPIHHWDMANLVLLGALNFCNCRNIELVVPHRPRSEARRIARTGIDVHTINVFPTGKSARAAKAEGATGVPLTSVRGHFACYGPEYDRGLLFGKLAGRFWIPQHARGSSDVGEVEHDYVLRSEAS